MATPPFGYCPECDGAGIKEDMGVVTCANNHTYNLMEAAWPKKMERKHRMEMDARDALEDKIAEKTVTPNTVTPPAAPEKSTLNIEDINNFVAAAQKVKSEQEKIKARFEEIYVVLKDLVEEIEGYIK